MNKNEKQRTLHLNNAHGKKEKHVNEKRSDGKVKRLLLDRICLRVNSTNSRPGSAPRARPEVVTPRAQEASHTCGYHQLSISETCFGRFSANLRKMSDAKLRHITISILHHVSGLIENICALNTTANDKIRCTCTANVQ